jgi:AhpD family alkylhydroperoxidase
MALRQMGLANGLVARLYSWRLGVRSLPNVFTSLAHHRRLFAPYMAFAYRLMPAGSLARVDTELLILRVAANTGCEYEWHHHSRIGKRVGLSDVEIERIREGPRAVGWSGKQSALLRAADELHRDHHIHDGTWTDLRQWFAAAQLIEICLLVGNYEMLATVLITLRVPLEDASPGYQ